MKSRITAKLEAMTDEAGRQVLDYVEYLESKYNRSRRPASTVERLAENIGDRLGNVRLADAAARGTAQVVEAAGRIMEGLAAASRVVAEELQPRQPAAAPADEATGAAAPPSPPDAAPASEPPTPA